MSMNIKKRNGKTEYFDRGKLERSMKAAGASSETASKVIDGIQIKDGITSSDLRRSISAGLRKIDKGSADTYDRQRRVRVQKLEDVKIGTIHLDRKTMTDFNLKSGDPIEIVLGSRTETLRAEISARTGMDAYMNNNDIRSMNLNENNRILVQPGRN